MAKNADYLILGLGFIDLLLAAIAGAAKGCAARLMKRTGAIESFLSLGRVGWDGGAEPGFFAYASKTAYAHPLCRLPSREFNSSYPHLKVILSFIISILVIQCPFKESANFQFHSIQLNCKSFHHLSFS